MGVNLPVVAVIVGEPQHFVHSQHIQPRDMHVSLGLRPYSIILVMLLKVDLDQAKLSSFYLDWLYLDFLDQQLTMYIL